jgi:hypothetical protein
MNAQEIREIQEAYQAVYAPQELTEEVEIATEYFYEMGLNEHGIDILIEELGVEEFVEWVDEIAEEYTLNEATRLQKDDRKLKGPKGSRPQSTTKTREKIQGGVTMKSSEAPKSTISARKRATKAAAEKQPETQETPDQKKQGIGGRIGAAFKFVKDRAAKDTELLGKSIQTARDVATRRGAEAKAVYDAVRERGKKAEQSPEATRARRKATVALGRGAQAAGRTAIKAAGAAGAAAGEGLKAKRQGKTGAQIAGRVAGTLVKKMSAEEYDYILSHLLDEGYANDLHGAEVILMNMSEDWASEVLDEAVRGSERSIANRITGNDIRKVTRGSKDVYKKPKSSDEVENRVSGGSQLRRTGETQNMNDRRERERIEANKKSIKRLNAKPGPDSGDYDAGYHGDDDTSGGDRHYSLSRTNRDARRRRASGR